MSQQNQTKTKLEEIEDVRADLEQKVIAKMGTIMDQLIEKGLANSKYRSFDINLDYQGKRIPIKIKDYKDKQYFYADGKYIISQFSISSAQDLILAVHLLKAIVDHVKKQEEKQKPAMKDAAKELEDI